MSKEEEELLRKIGLDIYDIEYSQGKTIYCGSNPEEWIETTIYGKFWVKEDTFHLMCRLLKITDMICESNNPQVQELYQQLVTLLFLTEEQK